MLEISCDETCRNVLHIAAQKFGLTSAAKLCLIQVERNEKGSLLLTILTRPNEIIGSTCGFSKNEVNS